MDKLILISNLIEASLLFFAALVLLLMRSRESSGTDYYRLSKRWMAFGLFITSLSIVVALTIGKFQGGRIEVLNIYSLLFFFLASASGLLSFVYLYNSERFGIGALLGMFVPVSVLFVLYGLLALVWNTPRIYSVGEVLVHLNSSSAIFLRVIILFAVIAVIGVSIFRYFEARRAYQAMLGDHFSDDDEGRRVQWIDRFFYWLLIIVGVAVGSYLIPSPWYDLFADLFFAGSMIFLVVRFVNYQNRFPEAPPTVGTARHSSSSSSSRTGTL